MYLPNQRNLETTYYTMTEMNIMIENNLTIDSPDNLHTQSSVNAIITLSLQEVAVH